MDLIPNISGGGPGGGDLLAANSLSELAATAATARGNLGLGSASTNAATAFEASGAAAAAVAAHAGGGDPHPGYLTPAEGDAFYSLLGHTHPGGGNPVMSMATVDLGTTPLSEGTFTIAGSGLTVGKPVYVAHASGPGGALDEPKVVARGVVESATLIRVYWSGENLMISGSHTWDYFVGG